MFERHFLVFCNVDDEGNIIEGISGINIIPGKQYDYFFYREENDKIDMLKYKVEDRRLVKVVEDMPLQNPEN